METRLRARRRETTVVCVRKMERAMRSAREGREGEESMGGRRRRVRWRRYACRRGVREMVLS